MNYGNLKNRQTANMAVFWRFLCGFSRFFIILMIFIRQTGQFGKWCFLKIWKTAKPPIMAVFRRFLCGFYWFFSGFSLFWQFLPTKAANLANYGLWKSEKTVDCKYGGFSAVFVRFLMIFHYGYYWSFSNEFDIRKGILEGNYDFSVLRFFKFP